jgi:hypothetical protein
MPRGNRHRPFEDEYYDGHETDCGIIGRRSWAILSGKWARKADAVHHRRRIPARRSAGISSTDCLRTRSAPTKPKTACRSRLMTLQKGALKLKGPINTGSDVDAFSIDLPPAAGDQAEPNRAAPTSMSGELQQIHGPGSLSLLGAGQHWFHLRRRRLPVAVPPPWRAPQAAGQPRVGSDQCGSAHGYQMRRRGHRITIRRSRVRIRQPSPGWHPSDRPTVGPKS